MLLSLRPNALAKFPEAAPLEIDATAGEAKEKSPVEPLGGRKGGEVEEEEEEEEAVHFSSLIDCLFVDLACQSPPFGGELGANT